MTATQLKAFFRTLIKVVAGGPAVGTAGSNRAAGVLSALDALVDFAAGAVGSVKTVLGIAPDPTTGDVVLPTQDEDDVPLAKRQQVIASFNPGDFAQPDQANPALPSGDPDPRNYRGCWLVDYANQAAYVCRAHPEPAGAPATNYWILLT